MIYDRTPKFRVKGMLRQIFLRSKERSQALKRDNYTCQICSRKATTRRGEEIKVEVHHKNGIDNWNYIIDAIYDKLLCDPDDLQTLCKECHAEETYKANSKV